jgi:putative oxidoreductase
MTRNLGQATHAILRVAAGALFIQHGLQKLFGLLGGIQGGTVPLMSLMGLAGTLELVGGAMLVLGLFTRPVSAVLVLEMIVAYFKAHFPQGGWPIQNGGELALLYSAVFLFFVGNGAGAYSLDSMMPVMSGHDRRHIGDRRERRAA